MEKEKKLDNLFHEARSAPTLVSFDEAKSAFEQRLSANASPAKSSTGKSRWMAAIITALFIAGGVYYFVLRENPKTVVAENSQPAIAPVANSDKSAEQIKTETSSNTQSNSETKTTTNQSPEIKTSADSKINSEVSESEKNLTASANKNGVPAPKYKKVEGFEKIKTEMLPSEAKITSTTSVGTKQNISISNATGKFKLHFLNGELNELDLNDSPVEKSNWNNYSDVIEQGKKKIGGSSNSNSDSNNFMQVLLSQMAKDNLVSESTHKILLTKDVFKINDTSQDETMHTKYLQLYKKITGADIGKNTVKINR